MTDHEKREKVISLLERYIETPNLAGAECYGAEIADMPVPLITDVITLLRAQEPRAPHYTRLEYIVNGMPVVVNHPECPRCYENGLLLWDAAIEKGVRFCKRCGQEVKWE